LPKNDIRTNCIEKKKQEMKINSKFGSSCLHTCQRNTQVTLNLKGKETVVFAQLFLVQEHVFEVPEQTKPSSGYSQRKTH
jgi:predicted metal-binding protein